jgi:hypothetical protein
MTTKKKAPKPKKSSVRHTRAIALDRTKRPDTPPPPEQVEQLLQEIIEPATFNLIKYYQKLGLRGRILTLPVMLVFVLSLIWRQLGSVSETVRVLTQEGLLWQPPIQVSQQAVSLRLRMMPSELFEQLLTEILPTMHQRWRSRSRPMPTQMQLALRHFKQVMAVDGSTLDALIKKVGLLREEEGAVLAGRMMALIDVANLLPCQIWYGEDSHAHDQQWWEQIIAALEEECLLLFDLGFVNYERYRQMTTEHKYFVTRAKTNMAYQKLQMLENEGGLRSFLVRVGEVEEGTDQLLRLVEVEYEGKWYSYLTNVIDCARLTGWEIAWLYRQRWRIEDAFKIVKRLLGLAYFHGSSINAIEVQVWATWLLYCVLIDLTDGVAEELQLPLSRISIEMVYRGLYHYSQALKRGDTRTVFQYLAQNSALLGIIKRPRLKRLLA